MKILVPFLLIFATMSGVFTATDSPCQGGHEAQIASTNNGATPVSNSLPASDCHHEGSLCHSCHLGHCAFVVALPSNVMVTFVDKILLPSYLALIPSDYPSSLFRPPIA